MLTPYVSEPDATVMDLERALGESAKFVRLSRSPGAGTSIFILGCGPV